MLCTVTRAETGDGELGIAFSRQEFGPADLNDVIAATQVWITQFMADIGRSEVASTYVFEDVDEAVRGVEQGRIDLLVIPPTQFLEARNRVELEPLMVSFVGGKQGHAFGLIARKGTTLQDLCGQDLLVHPTGAESLPILWLRSLLLDHDLPDPEACFGQIRQVDRVGSAVLPVFFGKIGACVVSLGSFETMRELNPQLGRELEVLELSAPIVSNIFCVPPSINEEFGDAMDTGLRSLGETPEGRQLLTLFGMPEMVHYRDEYLDLVKELQAYRLPAASP